LKLFQHYFLSLCVWVNSKKGRKKIQIKKINVIFNIKKKKFQFLASAYLRALRKHKRELSIARFHLNCTYSKNRQFLISNYNLCQVDFFFLSLISSMHCVTKLSTEFEKIKLNFAVLECNVRESLHFIWTLVINFLSLFADARSKTFQHKTSILMLCCNVYLFIEFFFI
jgi:hypothetical protein